MLHTVFMTMHLYRVLRHFNTLSDEYSVIFVSSCTAALKLVADSFQFVEPLPRSRNCFIRSCLNDADHVMNPAATAEHRSGDIEEFPIKSYCDEKVLYRKSVEDYRDLCDASKAEPDAKFYNYISSVDSAAEGCDISLHSQLSITSCEWNCEPILKPTFLYLGDNHTSVVGMRGVTARRGAQFCCIQPDKVDAFLYSLQRYSVKSLPVQPAVTPLSRGQPHCVINSLFVYPAPSNFSGRRYPLEWADMVRCESGCKFGTHPDCECRTRPHWYVLLDAAALLTTTTLDLSRHKPDFVVLSFYKMFGFPTGLSM